MPNQTTPGLREHTHKDCPQCGASLCAGLIVDTIKLSEYHPEPYTLEEIQDMYGDGRCYGLQVGIEVPFKYDGVSYWRYPCCGITVDRWTGEVVDASQPLGF